MVSIGVAAACGQAAVQAADEMAFETFWGFDHLMPIFGDMAGPNFECYTTMAALAAATDAVSTTTGTITLRATLQGVTQAVSALEGAITLTAEATSYRITGSSPTRDLAGDVGTHALAGGTSRALDGDAGTHSLAGGSPRRSLTGG